jgi:signal transduction histidine kinase
MTLNLAPLSKKDILVSSGVFLAFALLMTLQEIPLLKDTPSFPLYLAGRLGLLILLLLSLVWARVEKKEYFAYYPFFFCFLSIFYECHGQCFRPNYWLAYLQVTSLYSFLFQLPSFILLFLLGLKLGFFLFFFRLNMQVYVDLDYLTPVLLPDIQMGMVICTLISFVGSQFLIQEKLRYQHIHQRFVELGKNLSFIVHDIKGMISGPSNYCDMLLDKFTSKMVTPEDQTLVEYMQEDLAAIEDFVMELNRMVSVQTMDEKAIVRISQIVRSIQKIFKNKLKSIEIKQEGDMVICMRPEALQRILVNAFLNAAQAIQKTGVKKGEIIVYCEANLLGISDNAGHPLDPKVLSILNSPYNALSTKSKGSGLGVLQIKDAVHSVGGSYMYQNHPKGLSLQIQFPKSLLREENEVSR